MIPLLKGSCVKVFSVVIVFENSHMGRSGQLKTKYVTMIKMLGQ